MNPITRPAIGESTIGTITLGMTPLPSHQWGPGCNQMIEWMSLDDAASAAPQRPPTRAWLELDGRPSHQVKRVHSVAPSNPQISSCGPTSSTPVLINPAAMVAATAVPQRAPARLVTAASTTACPGVSTLVATTVAIELAVSWKPLM